MRQRSPACYLESVPLDAHHVACQHIQIAWQEGQHPARNVTLLPPTAVHGAVLLDLHAAAAFEDRSPAAAAAVAQS